MGSMEASIAAPKGKQITMMNYLAYKPTESGDNRQRAPHL
jgi:hypothetical protein